MEIKKEITVNPMTTDGEVLAYGDEVIFNAEGRCFAGVYKGISSRGAVMFEGVICSEIVMFNVMPKSIVEIFKANISVEEGVHDE